ncbi:hypothetical protein IV70_GL001361 [Carnobacterium maltaromaticum DSM 20342]|nr:hypothetical protein IV70_GL001361 [Carnobacterium maltaromaticum DSM 20342]
MTDFKNEIGLFPSNLSFDKPRAIKTDSPILLNTEFETNEIIGNFPKIKKNMNDVIKYLI